MYCLCMRMSYCIRFQHFMWQRSFIYRPAFWVFHRPTFAESKLLIHLHTANLWVSPLLFFFHHFPHHNSSFIFQPNPLIKMAAFSSQHYHPFLVHSPTFSNKLSSLGEQQQPLINTTTTTSLPPSHSLLHQETSLNSVTNQESTCADQSSKATISDTDPSVIKNHSPQTSMVVDKLEKGEQVTQKVTPMQKKRRAKSGPSLSSPLSMVNFFNHFLCFPFLQTHVH